MKLAKTDSDGIDIGSDFRGVLSITLSIVKRRVALSVVKREIALGTAKRRIELGLFP